MPAGIRAGPGQSGRSLSRRDLTRGSIAGHLTALAVPMALGSALQNLYFLVDLFFVSKLGPHAVAAVGAAGTLVMLNMGFTQLLRVGVASLTSSAAGRHDSGRIHELFAQSLMLATMAAAALLLIGYAILPTYLAWISADISVQAAAIEYLHAFLPGLALQFPVAAVLGVLGGLGEMRLIAVVQVLSVVANIVLAPVLILGTPVTPAFGVMGAGLASTISIALVLLFLLGACRARTGGSLGVADFLRPKWPVCVRMIGIGSPAIGEYFGLYAHVTLVYWAAGHWGADLQAAVGIGSRVLQAMIVPGLAVAYAAAPVAGQNYGAERFDRVGETFRVAVLLVGATTVGMLLLSQWQARSLVGLFTADLRVAQLASQFVQVIAWSFVAQGVVQACSALFQALQRTLGMLIGAAVQVTTFALGMPWLLTPAGSPLGLWSWAAASVFIQATVSLWWLHRSWHRTGWPADGVAR